MFQCRTRLCGWYSNVSRVAEMARGGFNAARGYSLSPPPPLRGPPPPLTQGRLFVYGMPASLPDARDAGCCIVPSQREGLRYFSFPHRYGGSGERSEPIGAPMPHAALWVVQLEDRRFSRSCKRSSFNAARGFVGGAAEIAVKRAEEFEVSMPHAALWVVQPDKARSIFLLWRVSMPHAAVSFRPHHRFAVPLPRSRRGGLVTLCFFAESREVVN